ncbi:MAG: hypothetical protein LBT14_07675, partial [Treponema sp.]|nr:hypothetical protein [Treponema sp.]
PHLAKYKKSEFFNVYYNEIFDNLNAAQMIIAVLIFRMCDNYRKRNSGDMEIQAQRCCLSSVAFMMVVADNSPKFREKVDLPGTFSKPHSSLVFITHVCFKKILYIIRNIQEPLRSSYDLCYSFHNESLFVLVTNSNLTRFLSFFLYPL